MPRDIPIGNGDLLVTFDANYQARDIYWPYVGKYNHTTGQAQKFGVWADGAFAWLDDPSWTRTLGYRPGTLVTDVVLENTKLQLRLRCADCVDFHESAWIRRTDVFDLSNSGVERDVRIFSHFDLSIQETAVGDTANYDPDTGALIIYKSQYYFLVNACDDKKCGIDHWAIGSKRINSAEGTWRDAEDGVLGRNAISQGSVDATVGFDLKVPSGGSTHVTSWFAVAHDYQAIKALNKTVRERTPQKFLDRTDAYWRLWVRKGNIVAGTLPEAVAAMFERSQLVLRTQVDNRGAIIAANDTDITHFAGDHYSYCWPRDGAMVAYSLILTGQSELSRSFFRFAGRAIHEKGYFLHKYSPDGHLGSSWHPWVIDGKAALPVQEDETALVIWALRKHFEKYQDVEFIKPLYTPLIVNAAKWMVEFRDREGTLGAGVALPKPSWDLWEERRGVHTFTVAATIAGLKAAAEFAESFGDMGRASYWRTAAAELLAGLRQILWNPEQNRFARMAKPVYGDDGAVVKYELDMTRDAASFALFALGVLDAEDPMLAAEMESVRARLWCKTPLGGLARYENDYYHQVERTDIDKIPGNPWLICTLWLAQYEIARAQNVEELKRAVPYLEWAAARTSHSGVLAEQFDPHTGMPISVSPLTWSHATAIIAVMEYLERLEALGG
ncbi:glycoside hydrolase family 15 protein [soil metagenome]